MQLNELSASDPSFVGLNCNADFKKTADFKKNCNNISAERGLFFLFFLLPLLVLVGGEPEIFRPGSVQKQKKPP